MNLLDIFGMICEEFKSKRQSLFETTLTLVAVDDTVDVQIACSWGSFFTPPTFAGTGFKGLTFRFENVIPFFIST